LITRDAVEASPCFAHLRVTRNSSTPRIIYTEQHNWLTDPAGALAAGQVFGVYLPRTPPAATQCAWPELPIAPASFNNLFNK